MKELSADDARLSNLSVEDVTAYLRSLGWERSEQGSREHALQFRSPPDASGTRLSLLLPRSKELADAALRLAEAINLLADIYEQNADRILTAIGALDSDVIRVRFPSEGRSSISLDLATQLIGSLSTFISYAACVEEDPRPFFVKATSIGAEHVRHCRLGHTFAGSFGFTIRSPIAPPAQPQLPDIPVQAPFSRRVVERIARGLGALRESLLSGEPKSLVERMDQGLNANMCDALVQFGEFADERETEYGIDWASNWKPPADLLKFEPLRIEAKAYLYLRSASRELRPLDRQAEVTVEGPVIQLRATDQLLPDLPDDAVERVVSISWARGGARSVTVRVPLGMADYASACNAHRDGKTVKVTGRLDMERKPWRLMNPKNFTVVAD